MPPAAPNTKRKALAAAERELASYLFEPNHVVNGPWYRNGKDLLTVVQYGIDSLPRADLAYLRLKDARLDDDYVRKVIGAQSNVSRKQFIAALNPKVHTNLNVLAWALPLGLTTAAVPNQQVQETYVILLNDAQMNDGSMVLEKHTLGLHLNQAAREKLAKQENLVEKSIRLTGKYGFSSAWFEKPFGEGTDLVVITAFKAVPTTTAAAAEGMGKLNPLDNLSIDGGITGLSASFDPESELNGARANLTIQSGKDKSSSNFILSPHTRTTLGLVPGQQGTATLAIAKSASNPLLGTQQFEVHFKQPILLPSGVRSRSFLALIVLLAGVVGVASWAYYHLVTAKHFKLWLPGYVTSFELPAMSQGATSRFIVRQPVGNGELAAVLTLPKGIVRALFYRNATLRWDPKLSLVGHAEAEMAKIALLPSVAKFVWLDRPASSGEFVLSIERPLRSGRNQRAKINVRFLALKSGTLKAIETS